MSPEQTGYFSLIIDSVVDEMKRQTLKFGEQEHIDSVYNMILIEEVGEVSKALIEELFNKDKSYHADEEMIHCIAVLCSWLLVRDKFKEEKLFRNSLILKLTSDAFYAEHVDQNLKAYDRYINKDY